MSAPAFRTTGLAMCRAPFSTVLFKPVFLDPGSMISTTWQIFVSASQRATFAAPAHG
jgi:hypothetical protein